jgi:hypothetical protein
MGSDKARRSYDASRMYRSVVSQQGRVTLEADANEAEEIRTEESRAELIDIVGPTGTPDDGFKISVGGRLRPLDFAIGQGVYYVGGVRVRQDRDNATYLEQQRTEWIDYGAARTPDAPAPRGAFSEAVYLTVTEQEISAVEDEALREVALGGPDTAARTRLIQRVHRTPSSGPSCETAFAHVLKRINAPGVRFDSTTMRLDSTMRLRVDFVPAEGETDVCQPTAQAGFLGPENQLIRVQVSGDGRMLWGWDNASFLYRVSITATEPKTIRLEGIPVDVYHQPHASQWVELLGTAVDLGGGAYVACAVGTAMEVDNYDPTTRTVTLKTQIPPDFVKKHPLQLFMRVWENHFPFAADEQIATELVGANGNSTGVRVYMTSPASAPGDYWTIGVRPGTPQAILPARLAEFQPPDGPRRWVAPLAAIAWHESRETADVTDCRPPFLDLVELTRRKSGCCELVVSPGEDIQAAIDSLPPEGGAVCLKAGTHWIRSPIRLDKSRVTLHGESAGTIVESAPLVSAATPPGSPDLFNLFPPLMLNIGTDNAEIPLADIAVHDIGFIVNGATNSTAASFLQIRGCVRVQIRRCRFTSPTTPAGLVAILSGGCRDLTVTRNLVDGMYVGFVVFECLGRVEILRNTMRGISVTAQSGTVTTEFSVSVSGIVLMNSGSVGSCRIEDNQLNHFMVGIDLGPGLDGSSIAANAIRRASHPAPNPPPKLSDATELIKYLDGHSYGIKCSSNGCTIRANRIDLRSARWGGIHTTGSHSSVDANVIEALSIAEQEQGLPAGIYCSASLNSFEGAHHALVLDNVLTGPQAAITLSRTNEAEVSRNHIDGDGRAWYGVRLDDVFGVVVKDNNLRRISMAQGHIAIFATGGERNRFEGNGTSGGAIGIHAKGEADIEVSGNSVEFAGTVGIWLLDFVRSAAICANRVANCGFGAPAGEPGRGISADAFAAEIAADSNLRLEGCEVVDTGLSSLGPGLQDTIGISGSLFACQLVGNRVGYTKLDVLNPTKQHFAVSLLGPQAGSDSPDRERAIGHALVSDNTFTGRTRSTLIMIWREDRGSHVRRFGKVTFSNNVCRQVDAEPGPSTATVLLSGDRLIVLGNHIDAALRVNAMNLDNVPKVALMGNVTTGDFINVNVGTAVPNPYTSFNVKA